MTGSDPLKNRDKKGTHAKAYVPFLLAARFLFAEQGNICVRGNFWHLKLQVQKAGKAEYC